MTRTTHPLVAHVAPAGLQDSDLSRALAGLPGPVLTFDDASRCLNEVPLHGELVFLIERAALPAGGMMWLILLAESHRGPVILIDDARERDPSPALRAGAQCVVYAEDFEQTASIQALVLEAFAHFERRAPRSPWKNGHHGELAPVSSATSSNPFGVDSGELRAYLRDALNEFRTPLTAATEFAAILSDGIAGPLNAKQHEYSTYIIEACQELIELYDDFRRSAGMRLGGPRHQHEVFKLDYAVEEALATLRTTRVSFRLDEAEEAVSVCADRSALITTISRIAQRAAKCSPRGAEVTVRLRTVAGVRVEIAILDQGPPPTASDTRLLREGLLVQGDLTKSVTQVFGVGMELARAILMSHGAELELSPQGERGARIAFTLPIAQD